MVIIEPTTANRMRNPISCYIYATHFEYLNLVFAITPLSNIRYEHSGSEEAKDPAHKTHL